MTVRAHHRAEDSRERLLVWGVWLLHLVVLVVVAWHHEPWRDELQAWRLAIDSPDLRSMARNARYEGHPLIWHAVLHLLGKASREWWIVAAFHTALASGTAWIVLRFAPLPFWQRLVTILGYYLFYEYAIIARAYGLGVFLAVAACAAWTHRKRHPWLTGLLLVLLANTSVMGLLVAIPAALAFFIDWAWPDDGAARHATSRILLVGGAIATIGAATTAIVYSQVVPPSSYAFRGDGAAVEGIDKWRIGTAVATPAKAFLPIARLNANGLQWRFGLVHPGTTFGLATADAIAVLILVMALATTLRRWSATVLLIAGSGVMIIFTFLVLQGYQRHHGHLVVVWLMSFWLAESGNPTLGRWQAFAQRFRPSSRYAFAGLHVPLLLASGQYMLGDVQYLFSDSVNVAQLLDRPEYAGTPIIAHQDSFGMAVAAHMHRPVWLAREGRVATYVTWGYSDPSLPVDIKPQSVGNIATLRLTRSMLRNHCRVVVITSSDDPLPPLLRPRASLIYATSVFVISGERYEIWQVTSPNGLPCPAPTMVGHDHEPVRDIPQHTFSNVSPLL
ncbi:MAG: hypothetical protein IPP90_01205 [Gemmatimonadaceae bacterium]|nr:hypothetical protein [Gemmatimonadaceae bacterium]